MKTTAFDLQMNLANPGMQFHKLTGAKDKNFWSVRVSADIRIFVHKAQSSMLRCNSRVKQEWHLNKPQNRCGP